MDTKKIVLWGSLGVLVSLVLLGYAEAKLNLDCSFKANERISGTWEPVPIGTPGRSLDGNIWVSKVVWDNVEWCEPLAFALLSFLPVLLLSLITYRMKEKVFRAWWNVAMWFVPTIIVVTLWLNKVDSGSGLGSGIFTTWVLLALYSIFIITVFWKITRAYRATKSK